jgi:hypothetical protein
MLAQHLDLTVDFNTASTYTNPEGDTSIKPAGLTYVELSNYDFCLVQFVGLSGAAAAFQTTLDSGAVQGITDGNVKMSTNYLDVYGVDVSSATNAFVKSVASGAAIVRFPVVGRYLKIGGTGCVATKVLVTLTKIS